MFIYKELKLKDFPEILFKAVISSTIIMFIVGAANVFGWMLTNLQLPQRIAREVIAIIKTPALFLIAVNIILLIAGTMVNASAAVVILTPIFLPIVHSFGIDPVFFGVLMVVNLAIGCITPPVGLDLFVASAITKVPIERVVKATLPFLYALLLDLLLLTFVPQIILFVPRLLKG